ncbi:MAG: TatD family hydrolase [Candidatus Bipolaricaulia bacterium]
MKLVDTHAHLDHQQFDDDREEIIQRAQDAGVQVITMGIDLDSSEESVRLAQEHGVYAAVGVHPHQAGHYVANGELDSSVLPRLEALLNEDRVVAVGEIGLDYVKDFSSKEDQHVVFRALLPFAEDQNYPVVIHNRETEADIASTIEAFSAFGVVHSFNRDWDFAKRILDQGYYLGVNGIATFAKDDDLQQALKMIPMDRLLVETDCPYLAPVPNRGKRNEPSYVEHVAAYLANHRGMPMDVLAQETTANAHRLFRLPPAAS